MRRGMSDRDSVCLFFVSGWFLYSSPFWISLGPPSNLGPISSLPHYPPVAGVSARWSTCGFLCSGLGALVYAGSPPVAACWGLDPWALSGLCLRSVMSRSLGSLGPWLDLLWHPQTHYCIFLWRNLVYTSALTLRPTGV
ncbi:hypothetical protein ILYODFUR_000773 [Ilyodon furcidens]|uniref:Uncharacterized protein n=1 Tax=Ilyodon furcidens TaxID=33524 RepID=A0ABV0TIM2_9TELE